MTSTNPYSPLDPDWFNKVIKGLQIDVAAIVNSPAMNLNKTITQLAEDMVKSRQEMLRSVVEDMPKIRFPSSILYLPHLTPTDTKTDVELVGGSDISATDTITEAKTAPTETEQKSKSHRPKFSLYFLETSGSVKYKRKALKALSLDTQHGRLLKMFIEAEGHFVSDSELLKVFKKDFIREISYILRNLKNRFADNNLEIIIERRPKSNGYVLIDIQTLQ